MTTPAERRVWAVLVGMALLGAAVRWVGLRRLEAALVAAQPAAEGGRGAQGALDRQQAAVDSARRAPRPPARRSRPGRPPKALAGPRPDTSTHALPGSILKGEAVDVNSATVTELERLPRIGPALAQRMVAWREAHGSFQGPEDLRHVRGIGPATARQLAEFVTFSGRRRPFSREASASTLDVPPPA
jgi:competence ComEA-like helix-hairpin-helix protein